VRQAFFHETDFSVTGRAFSSTARTFTASGNIAREFTFQLFIRKLHRPKDGDRVRGRERHGGRCFQTVQASPDTGLSTVEFEFNNDDPGARYEFRIYVGAARAARLRFLWFRVQVLDEERQGARFLAGRTAHRRAVVAACSTDSRAGATLYAAILTDRMAIGADLGPPRWRDSGLGQMHRRRALSNSTVRIGRLTDTSA